MYRAYKPYVSVVLHIPEETPKKALIKKEKKSLEKKDVFKNINLNTNNVHCVSVLTKSVASLLLCAHDS